MVAAPNLSPTELEIAGADLLYVGAVDPFGVAYCKGNQGKAWEQAITVDSLFIRRTVTRGRKWGMKEMFYCRDCEGFVVCGGSAHDSFIRCFGSGGEHCVECNC